MYDLLICCWILFARILLRIFASMFISDIGLQFSFLCVASLSGFGIRVMVALQNEFGSLPSSADGNPLQCSCLENPRDGEAWWAAVSGVAQSWTQLKQLSSSSNFLEEFEWDRCQLFSKFLVEFSCEAVWSWAFVCRKISDYSFNFCARDGFLRFSISSWFSFGKLYFLQNLSISSNLSISLAYGC